MHARNEERRRAAGLFVAATLAAGLLAPGVSAGAAPVQISPKPGAVLELGSRPVFKVRDASAAARRYGVYITISTSKKRKRNGDLKRTSIGTFAVMKRRGSSFRYKTPDTSFPTWFMDRPGNYYWQAFRIDCSAGKSCHVHTKIRSFRVQ